MSAGLALIIGLRAHKRWWLFIISLFVINLFLRFPSRLPEIALISSSTNSSLSANNLPATLTRTRLGIDTASISKVISLAHYLKNNLKEDETFIDFSNTPMLYFYAEKEVPSFFYQSPQNVHSIKLQKDWINRLENFKVPLIVMRHSPPEWWDATDGVPNEIRHYAFSDFLYQNYFPFNETDGFEIWKKTESIVDVEKELIELFGVRVYFLYKRIRHLSWSKIYLSARYVLLPFQTLMINIKHYSRLIGQKQISLSMRAISPESQDQNNSKILEPF